MTAGEAQIVGSEEPGPTDRTPVCVDLGQKFDPATATDQELARLHLPPRPDPRKCPLTYEHWMRGLSQPLCVIEPEFAFVVDVDRRLSDTSLNWSGAYTRPEVSRKFTRIQGMWVVPRPHPPEIENRWIKSRRYHSSTWIGLDGFDLSSLSLPQLGTAQNVKVNNHKKLEIETYAWWQWWVRDLDDQKGPRKITNLKVHPGDLIYCEITVVGSKQVIGNIKNQTTGVYTSFAFNDPKKESKGDTLFDGSVEGLTAEWVMERPTALKSDDLFTLANYGATYFYGCVAATEPDTASGGIGSDEQLLDDAETIEMVDFDDEADPGATVSRAQLLGNESVAVFYRNNGP